VTILRQSTSFVCRIHPGQKGRVTILGSRLGTDIQFTLILISVVDRNDLLWLRFHFLLLKSFSSGSGSSSGSRLIQHSFSIKKICTKSCIFNARSSIVSQKFGLYCNFEFFTFIIHFMFDLGPNPVLEPHPEADIK
jgi:hypothetical protein